MKRAFLFGLFLILGSVCGLSADEIRLADSGTTDYIITVPENASAVQKTAASELANYLNQITGAEFPIVAENAETISPEVKQLAVGPSKTTDLLLKAAGGEGERENYAYDNVRIAQCGNSVVLTGHNVRGMLYAVYTFLENDLGCRWWTASESTIPQNVDPVIEVTPVDYAPKLESRESFYTGFNGPANADFAVKMKCNGNSNTIPEELGGHQQFLYFVHSFYPLIPPEKYFLDHPDWFPEIDGVRKVAYPTWCGRVASFDEFSKQLKPEQINDAGTQLCLTNEGLFQEMLKNVLEDIKNNPQATIVSISQNDCHGYCTCEKCRAIDEEEGSHAGTLLRFVNRMAEEIEKVYPNIYVDTLAYQYTRKPPKITHARHNVIVRLCSIECSFVKPLGEDEKNKNFVEDMEGWSKMAPNIFVWDYMTDFAHYLLPFPNYRVWKDNINFFIEHNTIGLFEQGDYQLPTGDFVQMRGWVVAKLLWDPSLDQWALMEEFIAGYYAPELVPVYMAYFDTLSDACEKSGIHLGLYRKNVNDWLDLDSINQATKLQDEALKIANRLAGENPEKYAALPEKVLRERIPLDLAWALNPVSYKRDAAWLGKEYRGPADPLKSAQDMFARYEKYGVKKYSEPTYEAEYEKLKEDIFKSCVQDEPAPVPEFLRDVPEGHLLEAADHSFDFSELGKLVFVENDPAASNGLAVRMPGNHQEWALSIAGKHLFKHLTELKGDTPHIHLYLYARADSDAEDGTGMEVGIYDEEEKQNRLYRAVPLSEIKGPEYKLIDMGVFDPGTASYFWAAPPKRDDVENIWVDRLFFVWE